MKKTEERAIQLLKKYGELRISIDIIRPKIRDHLDLCKGHEWSNGGTTHLAIAYEPATEEGPYSNYKTYLNDYEVTELLTEQCQHCLAAHKLVQERKKLRLRLGVAKAAITKLSKELAEVKA